ncbi:MAG: hypothetical protein HZC40_03035 [Chloroflexi bacterium]|nr:hypothetical protein [Chloroflexota bacterium]
MNEPVQMRFGVVNTGKETFVLESKNSPVMDIVVSEAGGGAFLSWSTQNPDKVSYRIEWKPGESKVIELTWIPKPGDIYIGARRDIDLVGTLAGLSGGLGVSVRICASDICR